MIHEAYMPVYMGSRFLARDGRDGTDRGSTRGPRGPKKPIELGVVQYCIGARSQRDCIVGIIVLQRYCIGAKRWIVW